MNDEDNGIDLTPEVNTKNLSFTYKLAYHLFPDYFKFDTYRDKEFSRINKGDNYAEDLDCNNEEVAKICKIDPESYIASIAFLSHTKRHSASLPYSGQVKKPKPNLPSKTKGRSKPGISENDARLIERVSVDFHTNYKYHSEFHGEYFISNGGSMELKEINSIDDELYDAITAPLGKGQNDIILITGDIGCGKSTLLTNSLIRVLKDQYESMRERPAGYIRTEHILIDFEELPPPDNDDISIFSDKVINTHILNLIKNQINKTGDNIEAVIRKIPGNIIPILAFDNLDSLYTNFCKKLFVDNDPSDNKVEIRKYYPFIYELISSFTVGKYSKLGIRCIFAARNETSALLKKGLCLDDGDRSPFEAVGQHIKLERPSGSYINKIIKRRIDLTKDNLHDEVQKTKLEESNRNLSDKETEFYEINLLSIQGLRHTVSVCRSLSWALLNEIAFKRFFIEDVATRLFHYLGGKTHFSQVQSGITNIFLVNNRYRKENNQESADGALAMNPDLLDDHLHTYWLKYFILHYINKENVDKSNVIDLFSNSGKNGYPVNLVKLVIYSLSEIKHGRLVRPEITFGNGCNIHSSGIRCTRRAKYLIESNSFWSFCYLSLVIEDEWLEYPISVKDQFSNPLGFKFLFCTDEKTYDKEFAEYLSNKAELVLIFLDLLEISLEYEQKKYPDVFEYIKKKGVETPDISYVRKEVKKRINEMAKTLDDEKQKEILSRVKKGESWLARRRRKRDFERVFKKSYYTGINGRIRMALCNSMR